MRNSKSIKLCRNGCTRNVLLIGNYAIKFPKFESVFFFLQGMIDNLTEASFDSSTMSEIATTYYCNMFGLILVMERVRPVRHRGLYFLNLTELIARSNPSMENFIRYDAKPENFGFNSSGNFVKCDYA